MKKTKIKKKIADTNFNIYSGEKLVTFEHLSITIFNLLFVIYVYVYIYIYTYIYISLIAQSVRASEL